jgi:hypothetical protein
MAGGFGGTSTMLCTSMTNTGALLVQSKPLILARFHQCTSKLWDAISYTRERGVCRPLDMSPSKRGRGVSTRHFTGALVHWCKR